MDRRTLDRAVPFTYAVLLLASALFFSAALAPIAIFGALAIAAYYSFLRSKMPAVEASGRERDRDRNRNRDRPPHE